MAANAEMRLLVTGASGFVATHIVEQALAAGHEVIGTVRNPGDSARTAHLRALPGAETRLRLVAADLTAPDPFGAHADVDAIIHTASPYIINPRDPVRDLLEPARRGTLAALEAAAASPRLRRVVLTSSVAAITDAPDGRVLTEDDWNTASTTRRNPYHHSKTEAERAAWAFMKAAPRGFDLVAINPFVVIGPAHTRRVNTSNRILVDILRGVYPAILAIEWGMVDVRDVARAHLEALRADVPAGRYLCAGETIDMERLVAHMAARAHQGARLPRARLTGRFGTALMKLAALGQPAGARSYLRTHLGGKVRYDTSRIRSAMGLDFRPLDQTLDDTLDDLVRWGHIGPNG